MRQIKILLIDDEPEFLETLNNILIQSDEDYELLNATNVDFALEIIKTETPDLIISDWDMPKLSGIDLLQILSKNEKTKQIPVIICSGVMFDQQYINKALVSGAIEFIKKPIDKFELIARVKNMLKLIELNRKFLKSELEKSEIEKKFLEEKIEQANNEISSRMLMLGKYNELLKNTSELLKKLPKCTNSGICKPHIEEIIVNITTSIYNQNWENMVISFEKLYPSFFTRLKEKYPTLTKNEVKICAFLKLDLTTKEICNVTMQTYRAVEMARHRLRSKMGLNKDENIKDFLV